MGERAIGRIILAVCIALAAGITWLGFTVAYSLWPLMFAMAAFVLYQGLWTYLHNEALRRDLGR